MAHRRGEHIAAVRPVPGGLGEAQRLDVVALGETGLTGVDRHVAAELGEAGDRGEQLAADLFAVRPRKQAGDHAVEVVHEDRPDMAAAEAVVEVGEGGGHRLDRRHVRHPDACPGDPFDLGVLAGDQPVAAGLDEGGGGDGGAGEQIAAADVAAPELADLLDRPGDGRRVLEAHAGGQVLAVGHADLVDRDRTAQLAADRLGDDARGPAPGLLSAQPAGHGRLVVPQIEAALGPDHVDAAREARVGTGGFLDERLEPFVGLAGYERPCCHISPWNSLKIPGYADTRIRGDRWKDHCPSPAQEMRIFHRHSVRAWRVARPCWALPVLRSTASRAPPSVHRCAPRAESMHRDRLARARNPE